MKKVNLIVNFYKDPNASRQKELEFCLEKNIQNLSIDTITIICTATDRAYIQGLSKTRKFVFIHYQHRPTFNEYFKWSQEGSINIIANADIYFNESLKQVKEEYDWEGNGRPFFALSRWDMEFKFNREIYQHQNTPDSQDAWIFYEKPHHVKNANFTLGLAGCDNSIAFIMHEAGYNVINPSKTVQAIHYHHTASRTYLNDPKMKVEPPYMNVPVSELKNEKQNAKDIEHVVKSRIVTPHLYDCHAVKMVKERKLPTEWDTTTLKKVKCNNIGEDANEQVDGYFHNWIELKCHNKNCQAVKRISLTLASLL